MPKISQNATEQTNGALASSIESALPNLIIATSPVFICGVNRKINVGNFENVDIYAGLSLPLTAGIGIENEEELHKAVNNAANIGFAMTSQQTYERYLAIKNAQKDH